MEKKEAEKTARYLENQASDCKLLCNSCEAFICMASSLERRLSNYNCLDPTISRKNQEKPEGDSAIQRIQNNRLVMTDRLLNKKKKNYNNNKN